MSSPQGPPGKTAGGFRIEPLYWLLAALPAAVVLKLAHLGDLWVFIASCVAIIPLAALMGRATENLAETMGAGIGGLLNASFGNAAELIIAMMFLLRGHHDIVKYSLTGSIIGNILLVLGLSILCGGLRFQQQTFNRTAAGMGATLLGLATIGLLIPTLYYYIVFHAPRPESVEAREVEYLSEEIAGILAGVYLLSLVFSLLTHRHLFAGPEEQLPTTGDREPEWGRRTSLLVLFVATAGVALMSEFLVDTLHVAGEALGLNNVFMGVIVVAVIGNAAEHSTAVLVAMKNKMDLAVMIAVGSSLQIALFVAPVLVFASMLTGNVLDLHFSPMEIVAIAVAIAILALVAQDGESHWFEGVMLLAVYVILGLAFYHLPQSQPGP